MKRLSVIPVVLLIAGCGSNFMDPQSARARITPAIRDACSAGSDSDIAGNITIFETWRDEGVSRLDVLIYMEENNICTPQENPVMEVLCGDDLLCIRDLIWQCNACHLAIIDAVWR